MTAVETVAAALAANRDVFFPDLATIEQRTVDRDDEGGEIETWTTRHADIACQLSIYAPSMPDEFEQRTSAGTFEAGHYRAFLEGEWTDIGESDRCVIGEHTYDIRGIDRDSWPVYTGLRIEERSPVEEEGS